MLCSGGAKLIKYGNLNSLESSSIGGRRLRSHIVPEWFYDASQKGGTPYLDLRGWCVQISFFLEAQKKGKMIFCVFSTHQSPARGLGTDSVLANRLKRLLCVITRVGTARKGFFVLQMHKSRFRRFDKTRSVPRPRAGLW